MTCFDPGHAEELEHVSRDEFAVVVDTDHVVAVLQNDHPGAIAPDATHEEIGRSKTRKLVFARMNDQRLALDPFEATHYKAAQAVDFPYAGKRHPAVMKILTALELPFHDGPRAVRS